MKKFFALMLVLMLTLSCAYATEVPSLTQFSCEDSNGNIQTEALFAGKDMTVINIWSPWCLACSSDVPKFVNLVNQLPENVGFMTICDQIEGEEGMVYDILTEGNANYITLRANDEIREELLFAFQMLPVTIFVDSEGNLIGEPMVNAAQQANLVERYLQAVEEHLALLEA